MTSSFQQIAPGIWCLPLRTDTLPPATHTNCYLVGERDFVVMDPGSKAASERAQLQEVIDAWLTQGRRLQAVVLTHHHRDHVDGVPALLKAYGAPVWAHRRTAQLLNDVAVTRALDDEQIIDLGKDSLRCLHTPGHASGHLCLHHARTNNLLAGDLVASVGTIVINPPDGHMGDYLASLRRVRSMGAAQILPAHGAPIADTDAHLDFYITHRLAREAQVLDALRRQCAQPAAHAPARITPMDLVPEVYDEIPPHIWPLAARSLLAHLLHLQEEGSIQGDGTHFWV